jgi:hypothetical protein
MKEEKRNPPTSFWEIASRAPEMRAFAPRVGLKVRLDPGAEDPQRDATLPSTDPG